MRTLPTVDGMITEDDVCTMEVDCFLPFDEDFGVELAKGEDHKALETFPSSIRRG